MPVLGVEPAANIAKIARERGIEIISEFFSRDVAQQLAAANMAADVIHANQILAHVPDLRGFLAGIAAVLNRMARYLVDRLEFATGSS